MLIINRPQSNPYFNIAAEEYLLKSAKTDCFMLWKNETCIVVGKHQNTLSEINHRFVRENNIPVIRRISGGGTVFHDAGNLNFTFISEGEREKLVNFRKFIDPLVAVLNSLGVPAQFSGKSDIRVNGLKISGNAEHVFKNRVLHHGTLLFSSELSQLEQALKVPDKTYHDKGVKSVRTSVGNIVDFLDNKISIREFKDLILHKMIQTMAGVEFYDMTAQDTVAIQKLADEKYKSWEWNFGYSPDYQLHNSVMAGKENWAIDLSVQKGMITKISLFNNDRLLKENQLIEELLMGKKYKFAELNGYISENQSKLLSWGLTPEIVLKLLF
jgi:lipoate---protein ligase